MRAYFSSLVRFVIYISICGIGRGKWFFGDTNILCSYLGKLFGNNSTLRYFFILVIYLEICVAQITFRYKNVFVHRLKEFNVTRPDENILACEQENEKICQLLLCMCENGILLLKPHYSILCVARLRRFLERSSGGKLKFAALPRFLSRLGCQYFHEFHFIPGRERAEKEIRLMQNIHYINRAVAVLFFPSACAVFFFARTSFFILRAPPALSLVAILWVLCKGHFCFGKKYFMLSLARTLLIKYAFMKMNRVVKNENET